MRTPVRLTSDGETTSTLHYFSLKLHHFASRMIPIDTHFFIPIPSKTIFAKPYQIFVQNLLFFKMAVAAAAKGLRNVTTIFLRSNALHQII